MVKSGFSGEESDHVYVVFPSIVGLPKVKSTMIGCGFNSIYAGDETQVKCGILHPRYPIEHDIVTSWDDMEKI